jgi:hypothetical protein
MALSKCSLTELSQKSKESIVFPGVERSKIMQIEVLSNECWFKGAANKLLRILPPPISSACFLTELVNVNLLLLFIFNPGSIPVIERGCFFHIIFGWFIKKFANERRLSTLFFSQEDDSFFCC